MTSYQSDIAQCARGSTLDEVNNVEELAADNCAANRENLATGGWIAEPTICLKMTIDWISKA